jgi:hypothetical protein
MISEYLGAVWAVESMRHSGQLFGCLRCQVLASLVAAVAMMIDESLGAVWAVESKRHPWEQFR